LSAHARPFHPAAAPPPPPPPPPPRTYVDDIDYIFNLPTKTATVSQTYYLFRNEYKKNPKNWSIVHGGHYVEESGEQHITIRYNYSDAHYMMIHVYYKNAMTPSGRQTTRWTRMTTMDALGNPSTIILWA
jgi:hypothetical protein